MDTYCFKDVDEVCYNFLCPMSEGCSDYPFCDGCNALCDCGVCFNEECPFWRCE